MHCDYSGYYQVKEDTWKQRAWKTPAISAKSPLLKKSMLRVHERPLTSLFQVSLLLYIKSCRVSVSQSTHGSESSKSFILFFLDV